MRNSVVLKPKAIVRARPQRAVEECAAAARQRVNIDEHLEPVGVLIASKPVIASNVLVFSAAAWTLARKPAAS
jgi:hypothetical protein